MKIKKFEQINVIPFIDIMLVLLVIVLTTASFIAKGVIPLDLPKASSVTNLPVKRVEISIKEGGEIFFNKEPVDLQTLKKKLEEISLKSSVVVRSDKGSRVENFISVLDLLKGRGFEKIGIETKK